MSLATKIFKQSGEDLQHALDQIAGLQERVVIIDNDKLPYDQAIYKLDKDLFDQCNEVNKAFGVVETAYNDRLDSGCRSDLFWRVTDIDITQTPIEYNLVCTKLSGGGYTELTKGGVVGLGSTVAFLETNGGITTYPCNPRRERISGRSEASYFGFDPRNYYGIKYYHEPYSDDIGNTLVGSFIGTITQGQSTLTIMNPVGAGLSEELAIGQIIDPQNVASVFSGVTKIAGITTGLTDLRNIESLVGIADTLSWVNIITVDNTALTTLIAPQDDGTYPSFDILKDPDNIVETGRQKYSFPKEANPFLPQTVGIMQTANIGIGISIALDNSGYPTAAMAWDPNLEGFIVEYSSNGIALAGPVEAPKVGSGRCFWKEGFSSFPRASAGSATAAVEGATLTVDADDIGSMYGSLSACSTALETAITDAIGIASAKETTLRAANETTNTTKEEGLNALRAERNDDYSLPIWGMRCGIGAENEIVDRLQTLQAHLDDITIRDVIDA